MDYTHCRLCPRQCGVNRLEAAGFCRCGSVRPDRTEVEVDERRAA